MGPFFVARVVMTRPFCFLLCFVLVYAQSSGFQDILVIDDFTVPTSSLLIQSNETTIYPVVRTTSTASSSILGGERDLELIFLSGVPNLIISSGVASGYFQSSTPNNGSGRSTCQYDGTDRSFSLNPSGLGGLNFRSNGANSICFSAKSDLSTILTIKVYSGSANAQCQFAQKITPSGWGSDTSYIIPFSSFSAGCNFANVGAVEIVAELFANVDIAVGILEVCYKG